MNVASLPQANTIRGRVLDHRDVVAKFCSEPYRRLDARVCVEPDHDESLDAVSLELEIQIRVGKATRAPVFERTSPMRPAIPFPEYLTAAPIRTDQDR